MCFSQINRSLKFYMWKHSHWISYLFAHCKLYRDGVICRWGGTAFLRHVVPSTAVTLFCHTVTFMSSELNGRMSVDHWCNDPDWGKPEVLGGGDLFQCQFVYQKFHVNRSEVVPKPPRWETDDQLPEPWHCRLRKKRNVRPEASKNAFYWDVTPCSLV